MRYAVDVAPLGELADPLAIVRLARAAEGAGWDGLSIWDVLGAGMQAPAADPFVALAGVAAATERLRLIVSVAALPRRRPQLVAQASGDPRPAQRRPRRPRHRRGRRPGGLLPVRRGRRPGGARGQDGRGAGPPGRVPARRDGRAPWRPLRGLGRRGRATLDPGSRDRRSGSAGCGRGPCGGRPPGTAGSASS